MIMVVTVIIWWCGNYANGGEIRASCLAPGNR